MKKDYTEFKLGAIQASPVYFNLDASVEKACRLIKEAGSKGVTVAAFGECWLPGYPFYLNYKFNPFSDFAEGLRASAVRNAAEIPGPATDALCAAAKEANIDVVIGVVERDKTTQGTMYCTLLFISCDGSILGRHRKLKPTDRERTYWGEGDGSSLVVYERPYGRLSGLNCWEHNMMLPGYTLASQGVSVHVAAFPGSDNSRHYFLSQSFASQACCYVIDTGAIATPDDIPDELVDLKQLMIEEGHPMAGNCNIFSPLGRPISDSVDGEAIVTATGSSELIMGEKTWCDIGGHYSRPDIFQLHVNRKPHQRIVDVGINDVNSWQTSDCPED